MPFVAVAPASRESRLALAATRWARTLAAQPDLAPAVALQRRLIGLVLDLTESIQHGRLSKLSLPPKYLAAKPARAVPSSPASRFPSRSPL
jgi:hypothetical protein